MHYGRQCLHRERRSLTVMLECDKAGWVAVFRQFFRQHGNLFRKKSLPFGQCFRGFRLNPR